MIKIKAFAVLRKCLVLVLVMALSSFVSVTANAAEGDFVSIDGFLCEELADGTLYILGYSGEVSKDPFVIPAQLGDYRVTVVGNGAFDEPEGLKHVVIEEGITELAAYAFMDCPDLVSMTISSPLSFGR